VSQSNPRSPGPRDSRGLRVLLGKADLTEEAAATVLEVDEADIRAYVAAEKPVPRYVILALERIVDMRMDGR
jgi:plasmid maintenance system antidote protein VapI